MSVSEPGIPSLAHTMSKQHTREISQCEQTCNASFIRHHLRKNKPHPSTSAEDNHLPRGRNGSRQRFAALYSTIWGGEEGTLQLRGRRGPADGGCNAAQHPPVSAALPTHLVCHPGWTGSTHTPAVHITASLLCCSCLGQGRVGWGRAGRGRAGKGRAGQGRAGQDGAERGGQGGTRQGRAV